MKKKISLEEAHEKTLRRKDAKTKEKISLEEAHAKAQRRQGRGEIIQSGKETHAKTLRRKGRGESKERSQAKEQQSSTIGTRKETHAKTPRRQDAKTKKKIPLEGAHAKTLRRKGRGESKERSQAKDRQSSTIGTRKESSLHRSLKFQYSEGGATEAMVGDYVCDACTGSGELIEVQTGSLGPLKEKAKILCKKNKLKIVHPIVQQKTIELYDAGGIKLLHRRKSPKKGSPWDLFNALVYAPELPLLKNLSIELAVIDVTEKRVNDGEGSWRRKGVSIADRSITAWREKLLLKNPKDYRQFIPFKGKAEFTVKEFAEKAGINTTIARKALYVLTKIGLAEKAGKRGRAGIYKSF